MPTMAEYAKSGGYARDAQNIKNNAESLGKSSPSSSNSSSSPRSSSSSSGSSGSSSPYSLNTLTPSYKPPAISQSYTEPPSTSKVNMPQQVNGSMYSQVPGTDFYSTNPSNPNSAKYYADGRPVATVGYDNQQTGQSYHGYATPEQFQQITSGNNSAGTSNLISSMLASGQLNMPQSSIYNPSGGYANMPMSASQVAAAPSSGMPGKVNYPGMTSSASYTPTSNTSTVPKLSAGQQSATDWINNSASDQGGLQNYINTQQVKYNSALASGDTNMVNALKADMARVGYSLNTQGNQSGQGGHFSQTGNQGTGQPQVGQTSTIGAIPQAAVTTSNPYGIPDAQFSGLQAQANAQSVADIAGQSTIANQQKSALQSEYDKMKAQETDNRNLENFKNSQLLNPFSGSSDYAQGQIARERAITDRQGQSDLQTKLGNIDAQLADYSKASAAKKQEIVNNMAKELADYHLKAQAQQNQNDLTKNTIDNTAFSQQQDIKKQHIDLADTLTQRFNKLVYPTDDPMLSYAQVADIPTADAQKLAIDAKQTSFDNAIKVALANNTINQTQASILNQARNAANSERSTANSNANMQQDNLMNIWKATGKAPAGIPNVAEGTPYAQAPTSGQESKALQSTYVSNIEKMTPDKRAEFFKNEKSKIINDLDISGFNQLYSMYFDSNGYPKQ